MMGNVATTIHNIAQLCSVIAMSVKEKVEGSDFF